MRELLHQLLFLPEQASTFALRVDRLHYFVIGTTLIMSTAVGLTALLFFVRFRRRKEGQLTPRIVPPVWLEVSFIVIPLAFFLLWFGIGYRDYVWAATPPKDAMDIYVVGKQWMWHFHYPQGPNAIGTLHVPARRPVRLLMTSRDVIHSFFVPDFRVKSDVLPGRYTQLWFEATKTGRFQILCAEYCGLLHSQMWGEVVVLEPEAFDQWLTEQTGANQEREDTGEVTEGVPGTNMVDQGRKVAVVQGCFKCHTVDGTAHIGPTWLDLYRREEALQDGTRQLADEAYLTESMMDPMAKVVAGFRPVMPSFQGKLTEPEVAGLLEYIKTLRSQRLPTGTAQEPLYEPTRR